MTNTLALIPKEVAFAMIHRQSWSMYSKLGIVLFVSLVSILLVVCPVAAFEYKDETFYYKLQIPDGWVKLDQNILNDTNNRQSARGGSTFAAGFIKANSTQTAYPAKILIGQAPARTSFEKYSEQFASKLAIPKDKMPELIKESNFTESIIDKKKKIIIIPSTQKVESIGTIKALTALFVGKAGIVQLYFYSLESEYSVYFPSFISIIESFSFDSGHDSAELDISDSPSTVAILCRTLLGAGVGLGIVWFIKRRKKAS